jgi:hypothetical protein
VSDGPEEVATAWVQAAMERNDLAAAWALTDPKLRLVLAQHWIMSRQDNAQVTAEDPDALAEDLARSPSPHPLWDRFASERLRRWRQHWGAFNTQAWGISEERQQVAPGVEVLTFMEKHRLLAWAKPGSPPVMRRFAMRSTPDGWMVAGLDGSALFEPGWPPTPVPLPRPDGRHRS